jgi:hypothetical protein
LRKPAFTPDWVAGISIGAINAALIAGNPPEKRVERLREFWELITANPRWRMARRHRSAMVRGNLARSAFSQIAAAKRTWRLIAGGADLSVYNIIQLIHRAGSFEGQSKDYEFSRLAMEEHWSSGHHDAIRTLRRPEVLQRPSTFDGVFTFDLAVNGQV